MKLKIVDTTDGQFIGIVFTDTFPIKLGGILFIPDYQPIKIDQKTWRFYNSNYSIDAIELLKDTK